MSVFVVWITSLIENQETVVVREQEEQNLAAGTDYIVAVRMLVERWPIVVR